LLREGDAVTGEDEWGFDGTCHSSGSWLSHRNKKKKKMYVKPEAAVTVFELLMMCGV
jgi:hypothetical protein